MSSEGAFDRAEARVEGVGDRVLAMVDGFGRFALLAGATLRAARRPRFPWRETFRQLEVIGARSSTIVLITALFTGMVLALQTGIALERFGAKLYVGSVVGISLARELGPVLTALMVGGRVGAGITAVMATDLYPYLQTKQIVGLVNGLKGAAEYEHLIGHHEMGVRGMAAQSIAHLWIILLVIVGNIAYFVSRRAGGRSPAA